MNLISLIAILLFAISVGLVVRASLIRYVNKEVGKLSDHVHEIIMIMQDILESMKVLLYEKD